MSMIPKHRRGVLAGPGGSAIPYLIVGDGPAPILTIPGAGDGMRTVADWALPTAWAFRRRGPQFRTLVLSRRDPLPPGFSAEQAADDFIRAIEQLDWGPTIVECNSGGGPIGQWMAVKRPDLVRGLVLSSSLAWTDEHTRRVMDYWAGLARARNWDQLNWSSIELSFSPSALARTRPFRPLLGLLPAPRDPDRLVHIFEGLRDVDNREILPRIACPTLVVAGADDQVIGLALHKQMADLIPSSYLLIAPGYGHYNDQENPDYEAQVEKFALDILKPYLPAGTWDTPRAGENRVMSVRGFLGGAASGFLATIPMTAVMELLFERLPRRERYPLQVSEITTVVERELGVADEMTERQHVAVTLLSHFGYGAAAGAAYTPLAALGSVPAVPKGLAFGLAVWAAGYLGWLPALGILSPATRHPRRRTALMIAAHLVWGASVALLADRLNRTQKE